MIRGFVARLRIRLERRRQMTSAFLRSHFERHHGVRVGLYSYGCFDSSRIGPGTVVGRYCSIAPTAHILRRNHSVTSISMHPFLYNDNFPFSVKVLVDYRPCEIQDDVWIGHAAIILPSVGMVGRGAVIAAGAVVTKDVPPYAIVAGNPAKIVRMRFPPDVIQKIEETRWWELSMEGFSRFCEVNRDAVYRPEVLNKRSQ